MIRDAAVTEPGATLEAGICIVGGGAAGITLALRLMRSDVSVVLLESGGYRPSKTAQALCEGEVSDSLLHSAPERFRRRCLGGTTAVWGGRCVPLDPIDLRARPWIPGASWPIDYAALAAYYPEANALCEAGEFEYDARRAIAGGMRAIIPGFAPGNFDLDGIERFSRPTNFGWQYRQRLAAAENVTVWLNATATRLRCTADGARVTSVLVRTPRGARFTVRASQFVVATGGIDVPRLLLASNDVHAAGVGNAEDLVGRHYMCHIAGTIGELRLTAPAAIAHGYERAADGTYCRRRITIKPDVQAKRAIGNIALRLHHPRIPNPDHQTGALSAIYLARRLVPFEYAQRLATAEPACACHHLRHMINIAREPLSTAAFGWHWLRERKLAARKFPSVIVRPRNNVFSLDFIAEQVPAWDSRIRLASGTDAFGMPRVLVDWRYASADVRTVSTAFELLKQDLARSGGGELRLAEDEDSIEAVIRRDGAYGGHHIGTARMGSSAASGVVDGDCKVFGVNNLYIGGSATFPTSGQANPTLTIVALALRLADHLAAAEAQVIAVAQAAQAVA